MPLTGIASPGFAPLALACTNDALCVPWEEYLVFLISGAWLWLLAVRLPLWFPRAIWFC